MKSGGLSVLRNSGLDPTVADLLEQLADRVQAGETIDAEQLARDYPEHADQLRRLLPAVQALAALDASKQTGSFPPIEGDLANGVLGDFQIIREVGRGGMGIVYEAEQISLNRNVALKVLPFAATMDPRHLQRFRNEAQAAACLHHPNIVPVYGVGCDRGVHYYAMQLIEGQTLAEVVAGRAGGVNPPVANSNVEDNRVVDTPRSPAAKTKRDRAHFRHIAELIAQAADALEYAHSMGVLHRDIKPGNLMLDNAGHLWITDFGLAKLASPGGNAGGELTLTGDMIGTLRYSSPEQALAKHGLVDHRTDIYSLGATLYELLTLRPAVTGEDKQEILNRIANEEPAALRKLDKSIPAELETITLKCLSKDPSERYSSAKEMGDDLRRWLGDHAIKAKPPGWREKTAKWGRRHRTVVASSAAVFGVIVIALAVNSCWIWQQNKELQIAYESEHEQRQLSNQRLALARSVVNDMYGQVAERWLDDEPEMEPVQKRFLEQALDYFERLAKEKPDDLETLKFRTDAVGRTAHLYVKLGQLENAKWAYVEAIRLSEQNLATEPANAAYRDSLASSHQNYGTFLFDLFRITKESEPHLRRAIQLRSVLAAEQPNSMACRHSLAITYSTLGLIITPKPEAEIVLQQSIRLLEDLVREAPIAGHHNSLAVALNSLSRFRGLQNNHDEACRLIDRAVYHGRAALEANPRSRKFRDFLAKHHKNLALEHSKANRHSEAETHRREAMNHRQRLVADFPTVDAYQRALAESQVDTAESLRRLGRIEEAIALCDEAGRLLGEEARKLPTKLNKIALARALSMHGRMLRATNPRLAAEKLVRAVDIRRSILADREPTASNLTDLSGELTNLALVHCQEQRLDVAKSLLQEAIDIQNQATTASPPQHSQRRVYLCNQKSLLARVLAEAPASPKDLDLAMQLAREAVDLNPRRAEPRCCLGTLLIRRGEFAAAVFELEKVSIAGTEPAILAKCCYLLAIGYQHLGDLYRPGLYFGAAEYLMAKNSSSEDPFPIQRVREQVARSLGIKIAASQDTPTAPQ